MEIVVTPGARAFLARRRRRERRTPRARPLLWAAGGPDLPGVDEEVEEVRRMLGNARVFSGPDATRRSFLDLADGATLIHFAGHGIFRESNPAFSSLVFHDGPVHFIDLEDLRLEADVVVLSACRSGRSRPELALGCSLSRGFLEAGCRALVVSPWRVGDRSSRRFIPVFYAAYGAGRRPSEALRRAALRLREEGAHPADWAAFQVVSLD
jgi:CHAT domain-containing protein